MPGALPRPLIHASYHLYGRHSLYIVRVHRRLYDARDGCKAEFTVQKALHRNFIGRIEHHGQGAAGSQRPIGEIEAWEAVACRGVKIEATALRQIEDGK